MNCFCDLFQNEVVWLIIIALIILFTVCSNNGCGVGVTNGCGGCGTTYGCNNSGCGCC